MISDTKTIIVLGNGRCFHTLDWVRSAQRLHPENPPVLVTDLVESDLGRFRLMVGQIFQD